jgi:hypothetical protein
LIGLAGGKAGDLALQMTTASSTICFFASKHTKGASNSLAWGEIYKAFLHVSIMNMHAYNNYLFDKVKV